MRKYWTLFKISWQNNLEYRVELTAHLIRGLIGLVIMLLIFRAIFNQTNNFAGYTFPSMLTYLVMVRVLHFATRGNTARAIGEEIKEGKLSMYLVKPFGYLNYWFSVFLADRLLDILFRLTIIFVFIILLPSLFQFPNFQTLLPFIVFLLVALAFNFLINVLEASFAFWVTDIRLFSTVFGLTVGFFAGELIPLDVLPSTLKNFGFFLPFQYMLYFPIKVYQGSLTTVQIIWGMIFSGFWLVVLYLFLNFLWRRGVKNYEAVGQ